MRTPVDFGRPQDCFPVCARERENENQGRPAVAQCDDDVVGPLAVCDTCYCTTATRGHRVQSTRTTARERERETDDTLSEEGALPYANCVNRRLILLV